MKTRSVTVSFSRKVHPREYNPVETRMEETVDLGPDDDPAKARRILFKRLKHDVDRISERILRDEKP